MNIKVEKLNKKFNNKIVINNLSFELSAPGKICLKGESGSGKTTILNILSGLIDEYEGKVFIDDKELKTIKKIRKNYITYLPCGNSLLESLSIIENIIFGANIDREKAISLLKKLKIDSKVYENYPREISTGEYKRVCFARALAMDTPFYLLDEPTSNLDEESVQILIKEIDKLSKKKGVIIATHDKRLLDKGANICLNKKK